LLHDDSSLLAGKNAGRTQRARIVAAQSANLILIEWLEQNGKEVLRQS
jgi:hypothetical protein